MGKKSLKQRLSKIRLTHQAKGGFIDNQGKTYSQSEGVALLMEGKATQSKWKGGKKSRTTYEGTQYTGGRKKGTKNLVKLDNGKVQNESGVVFTPEEKKKYESYVNRNNRKRMKMLEEEGKLPRLDGGKDTGQTVSSLQLMGKESDFILSRKSKSLQRFKSKEDFEREMKHLEYVLSDSYLDDRTRLYKRNHMQALENVFGDDAKDVIMKIRMMKPEEYRRMIQQDEMLEVSYVYDPSARTGKLNQIRASLGMNLKEDEYSEPYDV